MVNKEKLLANAQKFISKGQITKAISEYATLVGAFPKDVRNRQKLAELLSRDKRDEEALKEYEAVAKHYTDTGFYLKAIAVFKQMQKIEPARLDIYHRLAELNEKQGLIGNALTEYRNLVAYYEKKQMPEEAADVLEKMLALDPDNLNIAAKIAECCMAMDQKSLAFDKFQEVVAAFAAKGDHAKVIKLYDHFHDICPEDGAARLPLARALLGAGSIDKALQILMGLVKLDPDDVPVNRCLADAYAAAGDSASALLTLSHLIKHHEGDLDLRQDYLRICIDGGEAERARDRLEEWKDDFFQTERLSVLRDFYTELQGLLPGDRQVAATLSAVHEVLGNMVGLEAPEKPGQATAEVAETAANAVLEMAIDDVETLDVVGAEPPSDITVPALASLAEKQKSGVELELDLDLDLDFPAPQVDAAAPAAEPQAATPRNPAPAQPDGADEDLEIELEVDLDDMDNFELDFDEAPAPAEAAAGAADDGEAGIGDEPIAEEEPLDLELPAVDEAAPEDLPEEVLAEPEADGLDGFVSAVQCETEAAAQAGAPTSEEDPGGNDGSQPFTDFDPQELAGEELEEDPATEELSLAGMELDLSAAEVGRAGEGTGLGAEEFFFADEEPEGSADAVGPEPADRDAGARQVAEELEEIRYYLQQGLFDDAERLAHSLMAAHPEHPQLHAELDGIERARQAAAAADVQDDAFGDLMSGLQDEDLLDATGFLDSFADGSLVDDDLSQKLVSELDSADTESHYNLGIAYKEMGLYGEAIAEFDKAAQDPARRLDCITLTGQCHLEAGDKEAALAVFRSGLADPGLSDVGRMTLNFELGMLHRQHGELLEALEYFQLVAEKDTFFREVSELIRALRKELGLDDSDDGGPQGNRDRVSYV